MKLVIGVTVHIPHFILYIFLRVSIISVMGAFGTVGISIIEITRIDIQICREDEIAKDSVVILLKTESEFQMRLTLLTR